jgi:hypothetical protein
MATLPWNGFALCAASPAGAKTARPPSRAHAQEQIVLLLAFFDEIKFSNSQQNGFA